MLIEELEELALSFDVPRRKPFERNPRILQRTREEYLLEKLLEKQLSRKTKYVSVSELAFRYGVDRHTIYTWRKRAGLSGKLLRAELDNGERKF